MRSAYDRVVRTLVISVGVGSLFFTILGIPGIVEQYPRLNPIYSSIAIAVFCGLPAVMALISFTAPVRVLRGLAAAHALSGLAFLLTWVPSMTATGLPNNELPWIINIITVATCMAAIALPFASAWTYVLAVAVISGFVRYTVYGGGDASVAFQDTIMIVLISGFMMALLQLTLRAGRDQDAAANAAQEAAASHAAAETLERQRTRYHAFTHDDVLATLLAASQDGPVASEVTKRSAMRTLEKMDGFRDDAPVPAWLALIDLEIQLRAAATALKVAFTGSLTGPDAPDLQVPLEVGDALTEALTEAMRNSVRHGAWPDGRRVHRTVNARTLADGVELIVADDGRGFNPRRVGLDRLGVRLSILQRVNSQRGGHADIVSARGEGTTVTLTWTAGDGREY